MLNWLKRLFSSSPGSSSPPSASSPSRRKRKSPDQSKRRSEEQDRRRKADERWSTLNKRLHEAMKVSDFSEMASVYFEQALQVCKEGRSFRHLLLQARRAELLRYENSGVVSEVQISTAREDACPACKKLEGVRLTVERALKERPLPSEACVHKMESGTGWCRCLYVAVIDR